MKLFFTSLFVITSYICIAQNLVPNGDFETYVNCPNGALTELTPWTNYASLSPDCFNGCADNGFSSVPVNNLGYQEALSGEGYAGIFMSQITAGENVREYISVPLDEVLEEGETYYVQFYVNLADISTYAVTTIGAYLSSTSSLSLDNWLVEATPQIEYSGDAITDTLSWELISGSFVAEGGEEYLTIGSFQNDDNCGIEEIVPNNFNIAYYYVDNVCVSSNPETCGSPSSMNENDINEFSIYPNPTSGNITINAKNLENVTVLDVSGKIVYSGFDYQADLSNLPAGIYVVRTVFNEKTKTVKLVKH